MHAATVHRMAHLYAFASKRWAVRHCRAALGIFVVSSALLLNPHAAAAQNVGPARTPVQEIAPAIAPGRVDSGSLAEAVPVTDMPVTDMPVTDMPVTELASADVIHEIGVGDTLSSVAQRHNVTLADLATYNQIVDYNHVVIGQKVRIPPAGVTITAPAADLIPAMPGAEGYHVVRKGEGMSAIAKLYGMTLDELMALNEIDNPNLVQMGTMLRLTDEVMPPEQARKIATEKAVITYTVQEGETLAEIAAAYRSTLQQLMIDNKLTSASVEAGQELRIYQFATALEAFGVDAPPEGERHILIDLSDQTLTVYQGEVALMHTYVSTGKAATPTRVGEFAIYQKLQSQHMYGDDYDLPGVPWVMYYDGEMAIHGAYWHANFGTPTSHGCTNMTIPDAHAIFTWAPVGTRVVVQQ